MPLAYSRGKGLPQKHIWSLVASRVAQRGNDRAYTNGDIRELKENYGIEGMVVQRIAGWIR